ncbi:meiotic recombination protein SPO11 isoform X2 [Zootermopsis nevadensis]|uniref:meiotic recombination protein SPO11 isoform X2 n=1 Tax=Zootermopsis nevadensis TaxID=136037 RepID=UPI000B8E90BE|nr:meiotic recombination protein SPO11 isoform X2 [Zootermopsis nevadensis]
MSLCADEVLVIKLQEAVKEIGAELRLAYNFTSETRKNTKNKDDRRSQLMVAIEDVMLDIVRSVAEGKSPVFTLRNQRDWKNVKFGDRLKLKPEGQASTVEIKFSSRRSRPKFALIIHLLGVVHRLLFTQSTCTRRQLYYQNVALVRSQGLLDAAVRDICSLLNAPAWELGVIATSKGLVAGPVSLIMETGDVIDCMAPGGVLIPQDINNVVRLESDAQFVLLVEKDATFQKLLDEGVLERLGPCILVTGKGFPDVATRLLVQLLWKFLSVPVLALVDADPHGIEIMCIYRFGSLNMSHQSDDLAVPMVRWLGVHPTDISWLGIKAQPLTAVDISKLRNLATRPYVTSHTALQDQGSGGAVGFAGHSIRELIRRCVKNNSEHHKSD